MAVLIPLLFAKYWCEIELPLLSKEEHPKPLQLSDMGMGKAFSYSYDGTNRGEAIVNKAMYIVYNEEAEAFTDLVEKFDRWHGALQKGN